MSSTFLCLRISKQQNEYEIFSVLLKRTLRKAPHYALVAKIATELKRIIGDPLPVQAPSKAVTFEGGAL